ncbi:hypothetical protein MD484_g5999, partial [Candolleomyces efflorescens]
MFYLSATVLSTKDAWAIVLKRVCKEYMLFAPSYPIDAMDVSQIKYAALGPYRWLKAIERQHKLPHPEINSKPTLPALERVHRYVLDPTFQKVLEGTKPQAPNGRFLVPGGRYLLASEHAVLQIVDMGVPGSPPPKHPRLVFEIDLDRDDWCSHLTTVQETTEGGLRVAVTLITPTDIDARVYDFFLSETNPYWEQVGSLSLELNGGEGCEFQGAPQLDEDRLLLAFCHDQLDLMLVWDFVKAVYAVQNRPGPSINPHMCLNLTKVAFLSGVPVYLINNEVWSWPIKSWSLLPSNRRIPLTRLSISHDGFTLTSLPISQGGYVKALLIPSNWYLKRHTPFLVDIIAGRQRVEATGIRYQLSLAFDPPSLDPRVQPTPLCTFSLPDSFKLVGPSDLGFFIGYATDRTLNRLFSTKDAWALVLKHVCKKHMLFTPSYPIDTMDLSQIKYAALGPYRWSKAVERQQKLPPSKQEGKIILPILERVHQSIVEPTLHSDNPKRMFLVPGGRFLVVDDDAGLWVMDFGVPGLPALNPPHVACKINHGVVENEDEPKHRSMTVQETEAGVLRIAIVIASPEKMFVHPFFLERYRG